MKNKIIEALLYIRGEEGITSEELQKILDLHTIYEARKLLKDFLQSFNIQDRGLFVIEFNDTFKFATVDYLKEYIAKLVKTNSKYKLTTSAIEVAGIIAYKQPVTRSVVNEIRGVNSDSLMTSLLLKGIIEEVGISSSAGQPSLYGITNKFYDYFRIKSLQELPTFNDITNYKGLTEDKTENEEEEFDLFTSQRDDY